MQAEAVGMTLFGAQIAGLDAVTQYPHRFTAQLLCQRHAKIVIGIEYGGFQIRPLEQARFGGGVIVHVAVVIEMVARQVGEYRDIECNPIDAALVESVRGDFHRHTRRTGIVVVRQQMLQADGVGSGVACSHQLAGEAVAERADGCGFASQIGVSGRQPLRD